MADFGIYKDNPTEGGTDGVKISEGSGLTPLRADLVASESEEQTIKCAVRCDDGFVIQSYTTVSFAGTTADKWKLSTDGENWQDEIVLTGVTAVNKVFYAKALSSPDESVGNDVSVTISASGEVGKG